MVSSRLYTVYRYGVGGIVIDTVRRKGREGKSVMWRWTSEVEVRTLYEPPVNDGGKCIVACLSLVIHPYILHACYTVYTRYRNPLCKPEIS